MSHFSLVLNLVILPFLAYNNILLLFTIYNIQISNAHTIDCSTIHCQNKFINCLPEEDCFVSCTDSLSCKGAIINCPMNGSCNIHCLGSHSCENTVIDGTLSFGNLNVVCDNNRIMYLDESTDESTDHCKSMKIYGSIRPHTGSMNLMCNGNLNSCINSEINCPYHGTDCTISCDGDTSCQNSHITSPINGDLTVNCNGKSSCFDAIFDGSKSQLLNINGCTSDESCFDVSLYCPPNTNGHKKCFIEGNDNLGRSIGSISPTNSPTLLPTINPTPTIITYTPTNSPTLQPTPDPTSKPTIKPIEYITYTDGIKIFAINGWSDVSIAYSGNFSTNHYGKMLCGLNYNISCDLAVNDWKCKDIKHCNKSQLTGTPSPIIKHINTKKTPWPTTVLIHKNFFGNNNESILYKNNTQNGTVLLRENRTESLEFYQNPTIFVFTLVSLCIIACMFIGCAQARRDHTNAQNEIDNNYNGNAYDNNEQKHDEYDSDSSPLAPKPIYRLRIPELSDLSKSGNSYKAKNYNISIIEPIDSFEKHRKYSIALGPMPKINIS